MRLETQLLRLTEQVWGTFSRKLRSGRNVNLAYAAMHVSQDCSSRKTGPAWCGGLPVRAYLLVVAWHRHSRADYFKHRLQRLRVLGTQNLRVLGWAMICGVGVTQYCGNALMIATFISVFGGCRHLDLSGVSQRPLCCCDAAVGCVGRKMQISVLMFILRSITRLNLYRHILLALSSWYSKRLFP